MSERTWDDNRETINDLWPLLELRQAEKELWHDDLSGLDQGVLYEALREVKRSKESPWPQLAWIHDAYRQIASARRTAERMVETMQPAWSGDRLVIDVEESRMLAESHMVGLRSAQSLFDLDMRCMQLNHDVDRLESRTAVRLFQLAREARERITLATFANRSQLSETPGQEPAA